MTDSIELVRRAQADDRSALDELFARYHDRVRRVVRLRMPDRLRSTHDSVDLVQEAFVVAIGSFDRFELRDESSLINWLARIAENCIRNRARRRSAWEEQALEDLRSRGPSSRSAGPEPADPAAGPLTVTEAREQRSIVDDCIRALPESYREVVIQRHLLEGGDASPSPRTWARIAEELGCPTPDAARMLYARARVELAALLEARLGS